MRYGRNAFLSTGQMLKTITFPQPLWKEFLLKIFPQESFPHSTGVVEFFWSEKSLGVLLCSFLVPARKEPKESGQRGAEAGCSRTRAAPFGIPRRALVIFRRNLTGKICYLVADLLIAPAPLSALCRYMPSLPFEQKIGTFFA